MDKINESREIEWVSVENLLSEFKKVDLETKSKVISTLKAKRDKSYQFDYVINTLKNKDNWYIYDGDLILDKSFSSDTALIVTGNLIINGIYDDYRSNYIGNVIVLGDMETNHIISWGTLTVLGNIKVKGLIFNYYNDYVFETIGKIDCRAFYISDKETLYEDELLNTIFLRDYDGSDIGPSITEVFIEDVLEIEDEEDDDDEVYAELSWDLTREYLHKGKNIFK